MKESRRGGPDLGMGGWLVSWNPRTQQKAGKQSGAEYPVLGRLLRLRFDRCDGRHTLGIQWDGGHEPRRGRPSPGRTTSPLGPRKKRSTRSHTRCCGRRLDLLHAPTVDWRPGRWGGRRSRNSRGRKRVCSDFSRPKLHLRSSERWNYCVLGGELGRPDITTSRPVRQRILWGNPRLRPGWRGTNRLLGGELGRAVESGGGCIHGGLHWQHPFLRFAARREGVVLGQQLLWRSDAPGGGLRQDFVRGIQYLRTSDW